MTPIVTDSDARTLSEVRARFLSRFDALVAFGGMEAGPLSRRLFGASDRITEIREGGSDIGVSRLMKALEALSAIEADATARRLGTKGEAA